MAFEVHPVSEHDVPGFVRTVFSAFGGVVDDESMTRALERFQPEFGIGISDQGRIVAAASAYALELTLPAGPGEAYPVISVPGVTQVGVAPTHRRQGLLTALMDYQASDYQRRGYAVAVLLASESNIYGRFGYGWAQSYQSLVVERARAAFRPDVPAGSGRLRLIDREEAGKVLPEVFDRARHLCPGELNRSAQWWESHLRDPERHRQGAGGRLYVVHESPEGAADGWVSYRVRESWPANMPAHTAIVEDLVALDPSVYAALWRFVLNLDLVGEVSAPKRPVDEALRWLLADPRRVRTTELADHLWLRVVDVPAALEARGYGGAERLVIEVRADQVVLPAEHCSVGRFVLESGPTSGACGSAKRGEKGQLVLGLAELGAIYLGGVAPSVLARTGRVTELQPGALVVADRLFASPVAPFCTLQF